MTVSKLSQIASSPSNPVSADTFVGVHGGNTDYQFSLSQVASGLNSSGLLALQPATSNLTFFVANTGSDSNPGTALLPFATIQHAANVAATFVYQRFTLTINVANGTYHETVNLPFLYGVTDPNFPQNSNGGELVGNNSTPTNCVIAPNDGTGNDALAVTDYAKWAIKGFSLLSDPVSGTGIMLHVRTYSFVNVGNLNINTNTAGGVTDSALVANTYSRIQGAGGSTQTFSGSAGFPGGFLLQAFQGSFGFFGSATWTFNTAQTIPNGQPFFSSAQGFIAAPNAFVTAGNLTGGVQPLSGTILGAFTVGSDPSTITWPGSSFTAVGAFDSTGSVDGQVYIQEYAGAPVDQSTIYRSSWQIHKDTNQTTAGLGLNLYVDDAGTVVPLIALTPAPGNLTFTVNGGTGSDSNPGTVALPFATIQHAISVVSSFDYGTTFFPTINVANGTYHENVDLLNPLLVLSSGGTGGSFITGNPTTPTNVVINPSSGKNIAAVSCEGHWTIDGFSIKAEGASTVILTVSGSIILNIGSVDFNSGTGLGASGNMRNWITAQDGAHIFGGAGSGGTGDWTFQGDGATNSGVFVSALLASNYAKFSIFNNFDFNSAVNLQGNPFFWGNFFAPIVVGTFSTPGNITNGPPLKLTNDGKASTGADPFTITWPGGTFDPTQIDQSSTIDGFFYAQNNAGQVVDESSIYRGSWRIFKDTTNVRRYLAYDDGGTIYAKQIGRVPNTQTGTPYVLALSDQDGRVEMNNAGANQLTVPANATVAFPIGTEILVTQVGAGSTTIAGAVGVTVDNAGIIGGQWESVKLYKRGTNEWVQTEVASNGANPTATAGPTAINGSAVTFMRSDAAPAIQLGTNAQKGIVQVDGNTVTASSGIISVPLGVPKATSFNWSVNNGYQLNIENRVILAGTQEATLVGNANLILTDDTAPIIVGTPKSNASFTLPTDRQLDVVGELVLNNPQTITLQGNSNLILTDLGAPIIVGNPKSNASFTLATDRQLEIFSELALNGSQRSTIQGNANLILIDNSAPIIVGNPKSNASFTLPTDRQLEVLGELVLNGSQEAVLQGNSNLLLNDDFGTRSRITLRGSP